jgi:hypothetical protein
MAVEPVVKAAQAMLALRDAIIEADPTLAEYVTFKTTRIMFDPQLRVFSCAFGVEGENPDVLVAIHADPQQPEMVGVLTAQYPRTDEGTKH